MVRREFALHSFGYATVKGTRHEPRPLEIRDGRPGWDRSFAVIDTRADHVLRTAQWGEKLLPIRASYDGRQLTVDIPGLGEHTAEVPSASASHRAEYWGRPVTYHVCEGPFGELLSEHLGRDVELCRPERGSVVYGAPVSLVSTASLADLGEAAGHPDLPAEFARFRPTFVIESEEPYVEETLAGQTIDVEGVTIRVGSGIPRCTVIDKNPVTGQRDARILSTLAAHRPRSAQNEPLFAVYGEVVGR